MDPASAAGIGIGGTFGLYGVIRFLKRFLGFKKCKWHSDSNEDRCYFGCLATKKIKGNRELKKDMEEKKKDLDD